MRSIAIALPLAFALAWSATASADTVLLLGWTGNPTPTMEQAKQRLNGRYADDKIVIVTTPEQYFPFSGTMTIEESERQGQLLLDAAIKAQYAAHPDEKIVVSAFSQSSVVAELEKAALLTDPEAPPSNKLVFEETGNLSRGPGAPSQGTNPLPYVDSQYNTIDITYEYDPSGRAPTYWLNVFAALNAGAAAVYSHMGGWAEFFDSTKATGYNDVDLSTVPAENITTRTNSNGTTTTYYTVPQDDLPILQPLRDAGVDERIVDSLNARLKPLVDAGYETPAARMAERQSTRSAYKAQPLKKAIRFAARRPVAHPKAGHSSHRPGAAGTAF
jgi:3'-(hydroxy)phthioceranyl-2'-palmitoyl(stearoyl)-2-O-sulfo-trehalose (hydroxy)phthioceranyltransferase